LIKSLHRLSQISPPI